MKTVKSILAVTAFLFVLGYAGHTDMTNEVIYTMTQEEYEEIKDSLSVNGEEPSEKEIARYYLKKEGR